MDLVDELAGLVTGPRVVVGLVGPPASGKSTISEWLASEVKRRHGIESAVVAMDGFHLGNDVLVAMGRRDRKGAPDTFDVDGFVALLSRMKRGSDRVIYAPVFRREIEEPIANANPITPGAQLVLVEGNYLLHDEHGWGEVRPMLDACWFIDADPAQCHARLVERQLATYGSMDAALHWIATVDEPNARLIRGTAHRADRLVAAAELPRLVG
jgi:pantothenate kinase